ncbi:MAG: aminomethyl-transferring glycine dehydrogenase subunit GcvPA, partial [Planctomycetota bacterium]
AYIPHTPEEVQIMLSKIGVQNIEELFDSIPKELRSQDLPNLPGPLSEWETLSVLLRHSSQNKPLHNQVSFLGGGQYDHHIPAVVDALSLRGEYFSAYTPYQAEASQGNLQVFFEFQSLICRLTDMDVANASMYDGATALAESVIMALHITGRKKVILSSGIHPDYKEVVQTYLANTEGVEILEVPFLSQRDNLGSTDFQSLEKLLSEEVACVAYQTPNFFGILEDQPEWVSRAKDKGALSIAVIADPHSLSMVSPPGTYGVDIVCGEGQSLGNPLSLGGPSLGFLATKKDYLRKIPGRIVGETVDQDGKRAFVLTLQTREQHIRREKATSNICTNQALLALRTTIYLAALGKDGFANVGEICFQRAHEAAERLKALPGFELPFQGEFFREFPLRCPCSSQEIYNSLSQKGILPGIPLGQFNSQYDDLLLVAVTEKNSPSQIEELVESLQNWSH